jgi:hypothetical protein
VSPDLSTRKVERLRAATNQPPDLVVVAPLNEWTCAGCSTTGNDLLLMQDDEPHCMRCAQLDHLVFLPAGDAKRTRQAHRASRLTAVVVRFSRTRKRYERQGLLVEPDAMEPPRRPMGRGLGHQVPMPRPGLGLDGEERRLAPRSNEAEFHSIGTRSPSHRVRSAWSGLRSASASSSSHILIPPQSSGGAACRPSRQRGRSRWYRRQRLLDDDVVLPVVTEVRCSSRSPARGTTMVMVAARRREAQLGVRRAELVVGSGEDSEVQPSQPNAA